MPPNELPPAAERSDADEAETPLHLHPGGYPKKMREASSAAERQAIIDHTTYIATTLGRTAIAEIDG